MHLQPYGKSFGNRSSTNYRALLFTFVIGLCLGVLVGYFAADRSGGQPPESPINGQAVEPSSEEAAARIASETTSIETPAPESNEKPPSQDLLTLNVSIKKSLFDTLRSHLENRQADVLNAQLGRILVWWIDLCRDVLKNDRIQVIYRATQNDNEFSILAVRYTSTKLNQTFSAYAFKPPAAIYTRFYDSEGKEIEERLQNGPIDEYEQITEIMDLAGRRHNGVDFKCDVGTSVSTPFKARVMRRNWNTRRNGNCLELGFLDSGVTAIYLHLNKILPGITPGKVIESGMQVAESGNTGRSTAAHLHYELRASNGRQLNPFQFHKSTKKSLKENNLAAFTAHRKKLDLIFSNGDPIDAASLKSSESNVSMVKVK